MLSLASGQKLKVLLDQTIRGRHMLSNAPTKGHNRALNWGSKPEMKKYEININAPQTSLVSSAAALGGKETGRGVMSLDPRTKTLPFLPKSTGDTNQSL